MDKKKHIWLAGDFNLSVVSDIDLDSESVKTYAHALRFSLKLALRVTSCLFRLALREYLVASQPRRIAIRILGRNLALRAHENFPKKEMCLNRLKMV